MGCCCCCCKKKTLEEEVAISLPIKPPTPIQEPIKIITPPPSSSSSEEIIPVKKKDKYSYNIVTDPLGDINNNNNNNNKNNKYGNKNNNSYVGNFFSKGTLEYLESSRSIKQKLLAKKPIPPAPPGCNYELENYRNGYPNKINNNNNNNNNNNYKNVLFYQNKIKMKPGDVTIEDVLENWSREYYYLNNNNNYIQWLFPIREAGLNINAQELNINEIIIMRNDKNIQKRIIRIFQLFLGFFGMQLVFVKTDIEYGNNNNNNNINKNSKNKNSKNNNNNKEQESNTTVTAIFARSYENPLEMVPNNNNNKNNKNNNNNNKNNNNNTEEKTPWMTTRVSVPDSVINQIQQENININNINNIINNNTDDNNNNNNKIFKIIDSSDFSDEENPTTIQEKKQTIWRHQYNNLNNNPHNYLTIITILKFLGEMGFEELKIGWIYFFCYEIIINGELGSCRESLANYWVGTVYDKCVRDNIYKYIMGLSQL